MIYPYNGLSSAINANEALMYTTVWMNLQNNMQNERSQTQNITYCMIPFKWKIQNKYSYRNRTQICGFQGLSGVGNREQPLKTYGFSFWCDENVLEINIVVAHHYGCTKCHWVSYFKMVNLMFIWPQQGKDYGQLRHFYINFCNCIKIKNNYIHHLFLLHPFMSMPTGPKKS